MSNLARSLSKIIFRWKFSSYDQYVGLYKSPVNSRIVVYGASNQLFSQLLKRNFSEYREVSGEEALNNDNGNSGVDSVAQSLVGIDEHFSVGSFIRDFPRTPQQAERLDNLLNGVNLAVNITIPEETTSQLSGKYLECKTCGQLFNTQLESTAPHLPGTTEKCDTPDKCNIVESSGDISAVSNDYASTYQPVLEYYDKRGLLLNFVVDETWSFQETLDKLNDQILAHVKL